MSKADHAAAVLVREWQSLIYGIGPVGNHQVSMEGDALIIEHNALVRAYLEREAELREVEQTAFDAAGFARSATVRAEAAEALAAERLAALRAVQETLQQIEHNAQDDYAVHKVRAALDVLAAALGEKP